jgi:hypothetical protein
MSTDSVDPVVNDPLDGPQRNPVERVIVWGGIGLLLVTVLIEARAQRGYATSLSALQAALAVNEESQISLNGARALMAFGPSETTEESGRMQVDCHVFSWFSVFKSGQYEITLDVSSDADREVLNVTTSSAPEEVEFAVDESTTPATGQGESANFGFGGGFSGGGLSGGNFSGGGGFAPPPDPLLAKLDTDTDGELSAEEIAAAGDALLALDGNGDGELSEEEFDPDGFRRRSEQGRFGSDDSDSSEPGSSRPRRPALEE